MKFLYNLELKIEKAFVSLPHLPAEGRKWLADNLWWIVLVLAIVGGLGFLGTLPFYFAAANLASVFIGLSFIGLSAPIYIVGNIAQYILMGMAVTPLREGRKAGWDFVFGAILVAIATALLVNLLALNILGMVFGVLFEAVLLWLLFEVRGYFGNGAKKVERASAAKTEG